MCWISSGSLASLHLLHSLLSGLVGCLSGLAVVIVLRTNWRNKATGSTATALKSATYSTRPVRHPLTTTGIDKPMDSLLHSPVFGSRHIGGPL